MELAENSEEFKLAERDYAPLIQAAAELDAKEEATRLKVQRNEGALRDALEDAKKRAEAGIDDDPAVVQAKRELAVAQAAAGEL